MTAVKSPIISKTHYSHTRISSWFLQQKVYQERKISILQCNGNNEASYCLLWIVSSDSMSIQSNKRALVEVLLQTCFGKVDFWSCFKYANILISKPSDGTINAWASSHIFSLYNRNLVIYIQLMKWNSWQYPYKFRHTKLRNTSTLTFGNILRFYGM